LNLMFLYIIGRKKAIGSKTEGVAWSDALGWQSVNFIHFTNSRLYIFAK